jgi:hypothetical protein
MYSNYKELLTSHVLMEYHRKRWTKMYNPKFSLKKTPEHNGIGIQYSKSDITGFF